MKIKIHRGAKEIGGSCLEFAEGKDRIVIDMGLPLIGDDGKKFDADQIRGCQVKELLEKKILPDIKGFYPFDESGEKVSALFVSHSHLDHYGLLRFVDKQIPVYLGNATKELIEISSAISSKAFKVEKSCSIQSEKEVKCGCLTVTPVLVDHSAIDAYAFLIESNGKRIFYSGDFRSHGRKGKLVEKLI